MQYKVHYLCMVLYGIINFTDEWRDIIGERNYLLIDFTFESVDDYYYSNSTHFMLGKNFDV